MIQRILAILLLGTLALSVLGCESSERSDEPGSGPAQQEPGSPPQEQEPGS